MTELIAKNWTELVPAYGRDYNNKRDAEQAFRDGKDFEGDNSLGFKYCSIRDFAKGTKVCVRYKKLTMVTVVTV